MQALEELQVDLLGAESVTTPERNPLNFATISTQTDPPPPPPPLVCVCVRISVCVCVCVCVCLRKKLFNVSIYV